MSAPASLSFEELPRFRVTTERLSSFLLNRLQGFLSTMQPLFLPRRLFGSYAKGGTEEVVGAEKAFRELKQIYGAASQGPLALSPEVGQDALRSLGGRVELFPWQYIHRIESDQGVKEVEITSPVEWVLSYGSGITLAEVRDLVRAKTHGRGGEIAQFALGAVALHLFLKRFADIGEIFAALRFEVDTRTLPDLGELPLTTIRACLNSFRPADDLLLQATSFSGVPAFIELVDLDRARQLEDPLKADIQKRL